MRMAITALSFAGAICVLGCQSAGAVAVDAAAMKEAASAASTVQQAQFYGRRTRHYVIKCYRELVIGPYVCHRFYRWRW
jgi:hypothetical protein